MFFCCLCCNLINETYQNMMSSNYQFEELAWQVPCFSQFTLVVDPYLYILLPVNTEFQLQTHYMYGIELGGPCAFCGYGI